VIRTTHTPSQSLSRGKKIGALRGRAGETLTEVMIAILVFTMVSIGTGASILSARRMGENGICEATARTIAQGIVEQLQFLGYSVLTNKPATGTAPPVPLKFVAVNGDYASIQDFDLPWAEDADVNTWTDIGEVQGTGPTRVVKGVVLDFDQKTAIGGSTVRNRRYMAMKVNLQRTIDVINDKVEVVLTYQWQPIARQGPLAWRTRELRLVKSKVLSY
jgi:hypothetical protein